MADQPPASIGVLVAAARRRLRAAGMETPELDARRLALDSFGLSLTDFVLKADMVAGEAERRAFAVRIERRLAGEPVHRILGRREFYGLDLLLSPGTLEPRPDTEILVDALHAAVADTILRKRTCRILDLGAGTGAIGLALLSVHEQARAVGIDLSEDAVRTARANATRLGLQSRYSVLAGDWYDGLARTSGQEMFDIIVSNPPYIRASEIESLAPEVQLNDPVLALDGGDDGLAAYRAIAAGFQPHLAEDGLVGVEIGHDQKEEVTGLFEATGLRCVERRSDLAGHDRVLVFRRAMSPAGHAGPALEGRRERHEKDPTHRKKRLGIADEAI